MKHQVLELILNRPNIRTVEIADKLDIEPDRVRPLIADELRSRVIVEEEITAPNGRLVQSFRYATAAPSAAVVKALPTDPLPARVLRALPPTERPQMAREKVQVHAAPAPAPAPVAAAPDEPLEIDVPVTRKEGVPLFSDIKELPKAQPRVTSHRIKEKTRVDVALDCLRAARGERVSNAELGKVMGIPVHHSPSAYLKFALKDGRVARVGKDWVMTAAELAKDPDGVGSPPAVNSVPEPVELPELVVKPRFPRADPAALAAYVPGSKRCTMNCAPSADDPRSAAERALLCGDCEVVGAACEPVGDMPCLGCEACPAEDAAAPALTAAQWVAEADPEALAPAPAAPAPVEPDAAAAWVAEAEADPAPASVLPPLQAYAGIKAKPSHWSVWPGNPSDVSETGIFHIRTGSDRVSLSDPRLMPNNGGLCPSWDGLSIRMPVPQRPFRAGIMSDGTLHLSVPGHDPLDLSPEHARELYEFLRRMGYSAWPVEA